MIIGVIGTRRRNLLEDFKEVEKVFLRIYKPGDIICSGLCPLGGDRFANMLKCKYNLPYIWHPPDWSQGRFAGFERNTFIAQDSDVLIARVHPDRTGGTEDTIRKFLSLKKDPSKLILVVDKSPLNEFF